MYLRGMKSIREPHFKELTKCLGVTPLKIDNYYIRGEIQVKKFRKYVYQMRNAKSEMYEVDIVFKGEMHAYHDCFGHTWYDSSILNDKSTSKIRINKNIRHQTYKTVSNFLTMFFGDDANYSIKKVSWQ